jgi:hypothetical protein
MIGQKKGRKRIWERKRGTNKKKIEKKGQPTENEGEETEKSEIKKERKMETKDVQEKEKRRIKGRGNINIICLSKR